MKTVHTAAIPPFCWTCISRTCTIRTPQRFVGVKSSGPPLNGLAVAHNLKFRTMAMLDLLMVKLESTEIGRCPAAWC